MNESALPAALRLSVRTTVVSGEELSTERWDELWALTREFYDVERDYAERELRKHQRIAMFHSDGALVGMASIDVSACEFRGRAIAVIYTSHVLLREAFRGHNLIQKLGLRTFLATRLRHPFRPIYWFFDTFSYKSYLLLPRNFVTFWPRYHLPTPPDEAALIDELATRIYGPAWRPARGLVVRSGQKRLRATTAPLRLVPGGDPHLDFFARANPGHAEGDMLVCLCPLTVANWLSVWRKALERLRRRAV